MNNPLAAHFPTPSLAPNQLSPPRFPGISPESTEALKEVLKDNHQRWHVFINDYGFHNHSAHRAIALWAVGASGDVIEKKYKEDWAAQKPAVQSPEQITEDNFDNHLGDNKYFSGYVEFFAEYIDKHGMGKALEDWVFSARANLGKDSVNVSEEKQPRMLARYISGVIHPLIHTGYGTEFGLPGMMAEGLAQCAVHSDATSGLVPRSLFDGTLFAESGERLSAFDILGQVYNELHGSSVKETKVADFDRDLGRHATTILDITRKWDLDVRKLGQDEYLQGKIEELTFLVVSIYGVSGITKPGPNKEFNADFFFMHLVTSSVFLPSLSSFLSPVARARLLHTYLVTALSLYVFHRCPTLDFKKFYALKKGAMEANAWLPIIQDAAQHHDEHVTKIYRALSAWASHFGSKTASFTNSNSAGIIGLEELDGSVFLRTAQLTVGRVGPPLHDHAPLNVNRPDEWDLAGFDMSDF